MRIQHNIMAMNAYRNYTNNVSAMKKNLEKLSSGYKINRAGDDAAGLAISEKMRAQITGLETAQKNAKDGISLVQTAEGALTEVHDMLNRMVELATQSANGTYDNTVDRYQLQKEVNQLLDEINRIADSSNFNGIKLLDGTLGMNTDAFTVGAAAKSVDLVAGEKIDGAASAAAATASDTHISDTASAQEPAFAIDFADLVVTAGTTGAASDAKFKVKFGGATVAITLAKSSGTTTKDYDANAIAAEFVKAFNAKTYGTGTAKGGVVKGLMFTAKQVGTTGKVTFEYVGVASTGGNKVDDALELGGSNGAGKTYAAAFNELFGGAVTIASKTGAEATAGRVNCDILDAKEAIAAGDQQRAGITFTLDKAKTLVDGNVITIDGKTFGIKLAGSESVVASDVDEVIDLSGYATAGSAIQMRQLVLELSNKTTDNFTIHTVDPANGKIHLEQTVDSFKGDEANDVKGKNYDYDMLKGLVEVKGPDTAGKNAGTVLDVTASKVKGGNVLTIGEGSSAIKVKFEDGDTTATAVQARIEEALGTSGYTVELATGTAASGVASGATRFIIRGADAKAATGPMILGKGLTLQIGDTSDSFNQLNVAVQDMHAVSLGIEGLKIDTEEAAQMAIQKIKDAINTVSDVRGTLGATQNRLDHTINNLSVMTENIQDAESTIRDTDVAAEMMAYTKNNILIQSAQAMLAQANQIPQGVLQLLQ